MTNLKRLQPILNFRLTAKQPPKMGYRKIFNIAKNPIYGILFLAKQLRHWKNPKRPAQEKISFTIG